jgi:hypothetical protein
MPTAVLPLAVGPVTYQQFFGSRIKIQVQG